MVHWWKTWLVWENKGHMTIICYSLKFGRFIDRINLDPLSPHELELLPLCYCNCCFGPLIFNNTIAFILDCFSDAGRHNDFVCLWLFTQLAFCWWLWLFVFKPGKVFNSLNNPWSLTVAGFWFLSPLQIHFQVIKSCIQPFVVYETDIHSFCVYLSIDSCFYIDGSFIV